MVSLVAEPVHKNADGSPLLYNPAFEKPEPDESVTIMELMDTMRKIRETTYADSGHAQRSVHVKSHGLLQGELRVADNLPPTLAQGIFAAPATYPTLMRISTTPGDFMLPDSISTPRGCALKVIGVPGERLSGTLDDVTQDFLMVNDGTTFQVNSLKKFLANLKLLGSTTDRIEGVKVATSAMMRGVEKVIEAVGGSSSKIRNMGGEQPYHPLGESFSTQVPLRFGRYMAKIMLVPVAPELTALKDVPLDIIENPTALRDVIVTHFQTHGGVWELRAQLCTDLDKMPVEDPTVEWPEDLSPYVTVATLTVAPQTAWSEARSKIMDDGMSFSPWHATVDHQPIGAIMRARKAAYEVSARFRAQRSGTPMREPKSLAELSL